MSKDNPGFFKRLFCWIGKFFLALRWAMNFLFLVIFIVILANLFNADVRPLPEKAPLRLEISGNLVEERTFSDPLTQLMEQSAPYDSETPIRDLIDAVKKARDDARITGLILDLNHLSGGGIAKLSEVGDAIVQFKDSGKPVIAIADNYSQEQYYLASFADEIYVNPMGGVIFTGFGYYGTFFKDAADKLKINFHIFRAGEFKSAVEPFTRNDMSDQARANTEEWIGPLWKQFTGTVERNRKLPAGTLDDFANNLPHLLDAHRGDLASLALDARLVDQVLPRTKLRDLLVERFGKDEMGFVNIPHKEYLAHVNLSLVDAAADDKDNIGLIVASGNIMDGEQMEGAIGGDSLSQLLQQAREDKTLKALVIRVDSPGGSAFASDLIRHEIIKTQETMPVVISMGSLAASGGYWIAAGADEIWALPSTLTGSIGVFGIIPTFENSLAALGVHSDGVGTTKLADLYHLDRPISADAAAVIKLSIENVYQQFLALVASGRGARPEEIDRIARGRVWTGEQALANGLVDKLGNLDKAIASAAARAGLKSWNVKPVTRSLDFQEEFLKQMAEGAVSVNLRLFGVEKMLSNPVSDWARPLLAQGKMLSQLNDPEGIYLQCFGCPR